MQKRLCLHPSTCSCEYGNYLETIIDNSLIMCDEVIDPETELNDKETKVIPTNFNKKSITCKI